MSTRTSNNIKQRVMKIWHFNVRCVQTKEANTESLRVFAQRKCTLVLLTGDEWPTEGGRFSTGVYIARMVGHECESLPTTCPTHRPTHLPEFTFASPHFALPRQPRYCLFGDNRKNPVSSQWRQCMRHRHNCPGSGVCRILSQFL